MDLREGEGSGVVAPTSNIAPNSSHKSDTGTHNTPGQLQNLESGRKKVPRRRISSYSGTFKIIDVDANSIFRM